MQPKMKALAVTLALATVVTAAACGDDDSPDAATADQSSAEAPAVPDVAGSDQHLNNAAEEVARQERVNAAATARLAAEAERQAHLDGQAQLYANLSAVAASGLAEEQDSYQAASRTAGNRAAQAAQADAYVQQQQNRAAQAQAGPPSASSNGLVYE